MKKLLLLIIIFVSGCTNTIEQFYKGLSPEESIKLFGPCTNEQPIVIKTNNYEDYYKIAAERFVIIGTSEFNATSINENEVINFGKKINAEIATISSMYSHTEHYYTPITTPNFSNTHTTINDGFGYSIVTMDSQTTQYSTQYLPTSARRYDYGIIFWRKMPIKPKLGIRTKDLNTKEREILQSNKRVIVLVVFNGSAAFKNDILKGDIITKINDKEIYNIDDLDNYMDNFKGKTISLDIIRKGRHLKKTIKLEEEK